MLYRPLFAAIRDIRFLLGATIQPISWQRLAFGRKHGKGLCDRLEGTQHLKVHQDREAEKAEIEFRPLVSFAPRLTTGKCRMSQSINQLI